ncbi:hypothetical protein FRC06_008732 [Ceratobasidium sp. 370]|nr:hypothetical protein FRC06_008732 [Ceratobasidium sp. 370]
MDYFILRDLPEAEKISARDKITAEKFDFELKGRQSEGTGKSLLFYLYAPAQPTEFITVMSPLKMLEKDMREASVPMAKRRSTRLEDTG